MSLQLAELPEDMLLVILTRLSALDLLSVLQTCRLFYNLATRDWVWHNISFNLPLDIGLGVSDIRNFPGVQLRQSFLRALRLDRNWEINWPHSVLRKITRISQSGSIRHSQFLSRQWLATLVEFTGRTLLSVWDISAATAICIAAVDVPKYATTFHGCLVDNASSANIFLISRRNLPSTEASILRAYRISLDNTAELGKVENTFSSSRPHSEGSPYFVCVYRNIAAVVYISPSNSVTVNRLLFIYLSTGVCVTLDPCLPDSRPSLRVVMDHARLYIVSITPTKVTIYIHEIPKMVCEDPSSSDVVHKLDKPLQKISVALPVKVFLTDFSVSVTPTDRLLLLSGYDLVSILVDLTDYKTTVSRFAVPTPIVPDKIAVGATGRRAVWIETDMDTDATTLRKATFNIDGREQVLPCALLDPSQVLPFELNTSHVVSLDLEEASGRVAVSLHTGDLYILDL